MDKEPEIAGLNQFFHFTFADFRHTYEWVGGFGAIFKSYDRKTKEGELREINGIIFRAWRVNKGKYWWSKNEIWWNVKEKVSAEWIRQLQKSFFCC